MAYAQATLSPSLTETFDPPERCRPISDLVADFKSNSSNSDENRIAAAFLLQQIRDRLIEGELGPNIQWREWMKKYVRIGDSERAVLLKVADSEDPAFELKRQRGLKSSRQRKYIENMRAPSQERDLLRRQAVDWLKMTSSENIARVLRLKESIEGTRAVPKPRI